MVVMLGVAKQIMCTKDIHSQVLIDTSITISIDIMIDIWLTSPLILSQHSTDISVDSHSRVN